MALLSPADLTAQMQWRYACKRFDSSREISEDVWASLENCLVLTPSSFGLQPWKFVVVRTPELRQELRAASWGQAQVQEASHLVVFAARSPINEDDIDRHIHRVSEVRGVEREALMGYRNGMLKFVASPPPDLTLHEWAVRQAYIALGNFMTAAAAIGVDTCPLEGIEPARYDQLLGLSDLGYRTVVACAAGYRSEHDKYATTPKVRYLPEEIIVRR